QVVARQVAVALRPGNPKLLTASAPASPAQLRRSVTTSLNAVFLALAGIALFVGAVGIANTTLVAVLERSGEIGLRRALGARLRRRSADQAGAGQTGPGQRRPAWRPAWRRGWRRPGFWPAAQDRAGPPGRRPATVPARPPGDPPRARAAGAQARARRWALCR